MLCSSENSELIFFFIDCVSSYFSFCLKIGVVGRCSKFAPKDTCKGRPRTGTHLAVGVTVSVLSFKQD